VKGAIGNGGWVALDGLGLPGPLYVRFREDAGRLRISELYLDASQGSSFIEAQDMRLPLSAIETFINYYGDHVRDHLRYPGPDLSTLASYFGTTFVRYDELLAEGNWVAGCLASQWIPPGKKKDTTEHGWPVVRVPRARRQWKGIREADEGFRLTSGPTEGLTDEFLRDVARAYKDAVARGEKPNVAIKEQTGYPLKTVQRWVYTARLRGIMPRGRRGAAG
jgi:hypothetical protein